MFGSYTLGITRSRPAQLSKATSVVLPGIIGAPEGVLQDLVNGESSPRVQFRHT